MSADFLNLPRAREAAQVIAEAMDRGGESQRRLLVDYSASGGVKHSATLLSSVVQ
jgi:hypothetical protein